MNASFKDVIQITKGEKVGLLAQVMSTDNGKIQCALRSPDGKVHFVEIPDDDSFAVIGQARVGPKPKETATLPPPLNPQELLEPIPPDVKVEPMVKDDEIKSRVPVATICRTCGKYLPGHATGGDDICTCPEPPKPSSQTPRKIRKHRPKQRRTIIPRAEPPKVEETPAQ